MNKFALLTFALCLPAALGSKRVANRPYVQSGPGGAFYARCIPTAHRGPAGKTEILRVRADADQRVDQYDWYAPPTASPETK